MFVKGATVDIELNVFMLYTPQILFLAIDHASTTSNNGENDRYQLYFP